MTPFGAPFGESRGGPGRPKIGPKNDPRKNSARETRIDPKKRPRRAFHRPKNVKNLLVFIVFSGNHPFGGRAASETEKVVKMTPKSSQKGSPEGSRNGQKSDPENRSILGPKLDAQGSILRPHWGTLLGFILLHFGGQILIPFRRRSWSAKRVRGNP